jgi:hypothetical protein
MKTRPITEISELEPIMQLIASELDTSPMRLRFISDVDIVDAIELDNFNTVWNNIKSYNVIITSINDNTDLYALDENSVVVIVHEALNARYLIFDIQDVGEIKKIFTHINNK